MGGKGIGRVVALIPRWIPRYLTAINAPMSMPVVVLFWCGFDVAAVTLFAVAVALEFLGNVMIKLRKESCSDDRPRWSDCVLAPVVRLIPGWVKPNHLSLARVPPLVPVVILPRYGLHALATALFISAVLLDLLDGPLARLRGEESKEGEQLDAYADKVLNIGSLWFFWFWGTTGIMLEQLVPITVVEILLVIGRPFKLKRGKSGKANNWGKAKMWYQSLAIVSITIGQTCTLGATRNLLWIALCLGLMSLAGHVFDIFARSK